MNRDVVHVVLQFEHRARRDSHARPGGHARHDRVIRAELQHPRRADAMLHVPLLDVAAIRAAALERDQRRQGDIARLANRAMAARRQHHQLLAKHGHGLEQIAGPVRVERGGDQRGVHLELPHPLDQATGRAGLQFELRPRASAGDSARAAQAGGSPPRFPSCRGAAGRSGGSRVAPGGPRRRARAGVRHTAARSRRRA